MLVGARLSALLAPSLLLIRQTVDWRSDTARTLTGARRRLSNRRRDEPFARFGKFETARPEHVALQKKSGQRKTVDEVLA